MAKLNIGIIGGIGAGKDTLGTAIVNVLNGLIKDYAPSLTIAFVCKFAEHIHEAAKVAGFSLERKDKEEPVVMDITDLMFSVTCLLDKIGERGLCSGHQRHQAYSKLHRAFVTTYGSVRNLGKDVIISPRTFMQIVGNTIREVIGEDTWVELAITKQDYEINIFTDTRYANEVEFMDLIIFIKSDRSLPSDDVSEQLAKTYNPLLDDRCIAIVTNNKDTPISDLLCEAATLAAGIYSIATKMNSYFKK